MGDYAIIAISDIITVELIRFGYAVEKATDAILQTTLPDALVKRLRKAN